MATTGTSGAVERESRATSKLTRAQLDEKTKEELVDYAEQMGVEVSQSWLKDEIIDAIVKRDKTGTSQIVVVDLEEQPYRLVRLLRKGRGKLMTHVERIVADLAEAGTVKSGAQPVVIVVRVEPELFWFLGYDD
jgi:hypothetical protein